MPLLITCSCGKKLQVRDEWAGKKIKCPGCGKVVAAEPVAEAVRLEKPRAAPPPLPPPDAEESEPRSKPVKEEAGAAPLFWRCPHNFGQRLLVLTEEGFFYASLGDQDLDQAEEDLGDEEAPKEALGKDTVVLPFSIITRIDTNKQQASITVFFKGMEDGQEAIVNEVFVFSEPKERDRAFKTLRQWLEPRWHYARKDYSSLEAAVAPLVAIGVTAAVTVGLAWLADWLSTWTGRARIPWWAAFLYHAMMYLGPMGISVIGGLVILCCVIWLIVRVQTPPIMLTLTPPAADAAAKDDDPDEE